MQQYLESTNYIDWSVPEVAQSAARIAGDARCELDIVKACFEFVRDEIKHSWDHAMNPVTCKASEVLKYRTGYCFAKSHLLAALLRANQIPAGLCYQRLTVSDNKSRFCLHGLNAVFLQDFGWYKVDARGNKPGVTAGFCPPEEWLPFSASLDGEVTFSKIVAKPLVQVVGILESCESYLDVARNLPDAEWF